MATFTSARRPLRRVRDLTQAQFVAACERHGIRPTPGFLGYHTLGEGTGGRRVSIGNAPDRRRDQLAYLLAQQTKARAETARDEAARIEREQQQQIADHEEAERRGLSPAEAAAFVAGAAHQRAGNEEQREARRLVLDADRRAALQASGEHMRRAFEPVMRKVLR